MHIASHILRPDQQGSQGARVPHTFLIPYQPLFASHQKPAVLLQARDGPKAWQTIQDERHDLVLLDVMMPQMNGYEIRTLRPDQIIE